MWTSNVTKGQERKGEGVNIFSNLYTSYLLSILETVKGYSRLSNKVLSVYALHGHIKAEDNQVRIRYVRFRESLRVYLLHK